MSRRSRVPWHAVAAVLALAAVRHAQAGSLASGLHEFVEQNSSLFVGVADTLTPLVERLAARATALPATSTVPGFTYVSDVESGAFERVPGAFGAVLVDRPETVGRGVMAIGASYLHADLDEFDGHSLAGEVDFRSRVALNGDVARTRLDFTEFALTLDTVSPFVTYGLTERWDASLLLPLMRTRLAARARRLARVDQAGDQPAIVIRDTVALDDDSFGVGDMLLRTKYRLVDDEPIGVAALLGVRAPTGDPADFRGLGDWTIEPSLVAAHRFGAHDLHASLGFEVNADALERSRGRYAVGGAVQLHPRVAALLDVIGSSAFVADEFTIDASGTTPRSRFLSRFETRPVEQLGGLRVRVFSSVPRTDIVDLAVGAKLQLFSRAAGFVSVLVPIVRDGLRAAVVPVGGIEFTF